MYLYGDDYMADEQQAQEPVEVQEIIRIADTDVDGTKRIEDAIQDIKGVSYSFANAVTEKIEFDPDTRIGSLSDDELDAIENVIRDPASVDIPGWMRNRRKDRKTGDDKHLIESDLMMTEEFDIRRLKNINSYRGQRHRMGLPVRGQKTKSSFRSGDKIGVRRARVQEEAEEDRCDTMRKQGKNYETPTRAWQRDRIQEEKRLISDYGLTSKKEVWKAQSMVRTFRRQARKLNAGENEAQKEELLNKMTSLGVLDSGASINDILDAEVEDILERRLQTIIYRRGLADTPKQARQFITHGHVMIDNSRVTVPSYLVPQNEEGDIRISPGSKHLVANTDEQEA